MLKKFVAVVLLLVLVFVAIVAAQPSEFRVARAAMIQAAPEKVFQQVNDLRNWAAWSPWDKLDPNQKKSYDGPAAGVGASMTWSGNDDVGAGKMTVTDSLPEQAIRITLEFLKPFSATNQVDFSFKPVTNGTEVEWSMTGRRSFVLKAFGLVMDMDKMIGGDFEKGLNQLKAVAESH